MGGAGVREFLYYGSIFEIKKIWRDGGWTGGSHKESKSKNIFFSFFFFFFGGGGGAG